MPRGRSSHRWSFTDATAPFFDADHREPARFVLRQVGADRFTVQETFVYDDGIDEVVVPADTHVATDLASIPFFMAWFVPVNGLHTPAALVHDTMLGGVRSADDPAGWSAPGVHDLRVRADEVFLRAMAASGVPLLRRRLMYAAVVLATRWTRSTITRTGVVLWVLASIVGSGALVCSLASWTWWVVVPALAAPVPAGLLWGYRHWRTAILAGYGAWLIGLPSLVTALGYGTYWVAEQISRVLSGGDESPPAPYR